MFQTTNQKMVKEPFKFLPICSPGETSPKVASLMALALSRKASRCASRIKKSGWGFPARHGGIQKWLVPFMENSI